MAVLVFEIGGSSIRAGLYDPKTRAIIRETRADTPNFHRLPDADAEAILAQLSDRLRELGRALGTGLKPEVGIGYPGPISPSGLALASPTLLGAERDHPVDIAALVGDALAASRVLVMNDVTACGYRYVADGLADFCLINIGSGIGNKLFLAGSAVVGPMGRGGEMGHFTVDSSPDAALCECGGRGHLAGLSSGRGTERHLRAAAMSDSEGFAKSRLSFLAPQPNAILTTHIAAAFADADRWTIDRVAEAAAPLACTIAGLHTAIGIERFVLVGGFAQGLGARYRELLVDLCRPAAWDLGQDWDAMLTLGAAGDQDGLLGLGHAVSRRL